MTDAFIPSSYCDEVQINLGILCPPSHYCLRRMNKFTAISTTDFWSVSSNPECYTPYISSYIPCISKRKKYFDYQCRIISDLSHVPRFHSLLQRPFISVLILLLILLKRANPAEGWFLTEVKNIALLSKKKVVKKHNRLSILVKFLYMNAFKPVELVLGNHRRFIRSHNVLSSERN